MKLKKAAKKFLKLLAKELDLPKGSPNSEVRTAFEQGLQLVKYSELQAELNNNAEDYLSLLQRYISESQIEGGYLNNVVEHHTSERVSSETDQKKIEGKYEYPFNLYLSEGNIKETDEVLVYRCYLSQHFDESLVQKIAETTDKEALVICNVTQGSSEPLERLMMLFHRKMSTIVEEAFVDMKKKRLRNIGRELLRYMLYFNMKYNPKERIQNDDRPSGPKYEDIVAALLSLYFDIICIVSRELGELEVEKEQKRLMMLINHLLRFSQQHVMDVFIQMTQMTSDDTPFLLPFVRNIIERPSFSLKQPEVYTKYVLAVNKIISSLKGEEIQHLHQLALGTKAPKKYLKWLREKDEDVLENMPDNVPSFKGVNITRHLLEESNEDVFERLLNLLTIEETVLPEDELEESISQKPMDVANEDLFFIDKATTKSNIQNNVLEEDEDEEIVIDDDMLDRELAAMDAEENESEQSDQSDPDSESDTDHPPSNILERTSKALDRIGEDTSEGGSDVEAIEVMETEEVTELIETQDNPPCEMKSPKKNGTSPIVQGKARLTPNTDRNEAVFFIDASPSKVKIDKSQAKDSESSEADSVKVISSPVKDQQHISSSDSLAPIVCVGPDIMLSPPNRATLGSPKLKDLDRDKPIDFNSDDAKKKSQIFLERGITKSTLVESGDDSSSLGSPRRSRRSPKKKPGISVPGQSPRKTPNGNISVNSPRKTAIVTRENDVEIYDLSSTLGSDTTFSEVDSPKRMWSTKIESTRADMSEAGTSCVLDTGSDTSALSVEDIQEETFIRASRSRTVSQTSGVSATSTESIGSITRSKRSLVLSPKRSPAVSRIRNTPTPTKFGKDAVNSGSPRGKSQRRSSLSHTKEPTPKKQKVEATPDSPRSLRSSAKKLSSKTLQ